MLFWDTVRFVQLLKDEQSFHPSQAGYFLRMGNENVLLNIGVKNILD